MSAGLTIIVRGETFTLSEDQIKFEESSLFTKFIDNHSETPRPPMQSSRNPRLFALIVDYLCGYEILPIHDANIPHGMTQETVLKNLKADAVYYELRKLVELIQQQSIAPISAKPQIAPDKPKESSVNPRTSPFFHFPGRLTSRFRYWDDSPTSFVEFPVSIDLMKSFTITLWYRYVRTGDEAGRYTVLSFDVPSTPHELLQISISPGGEFRFELGVRATRDNSSLVPSNLIDTDYDRLTLGPSDTGAPLHIWTHLAFVQQIDDSGDVGGRTLYLDGKELLKSSGNNHIYNPAPSQTRMALMRGCWDHQRTNGFVGQIEDVASSSVIDEIHCVKDELASRSSKEKMPLDHGWTKDLEDWDFDPVY
ncbi:unnamed protein product [Rhizoctonia solani]|uniref:BTB domain-containing protein n=1 Tax=Rhizoctonia solani TaxID=456999 RepID=A0A8H3HZ97_9AGAM|nr:unnamed protein product [Rhizoctonia solani]CAE7156564.1 unnamed protein product [Rhizoctonia solani]